MTGRSKKGTATVSVKKTAKATTSKRPGPPRTSDVQLAEIVGLLDHVHSVEIKLTIPATAHRTTIRGLPLDPVEAEPRQVFFFDTPDLALNKAGIVARARRIQGGEADTVIKLRPVVPKDLPASLRKSGACKIELDVMPGGYVCSASIKGNTTGQEVSDAVEGRIKLSKLFSKKQRTFFKKHAPGHLDLDKTVTLGPTFLLKSQFFVKKLDRKVVAEVWLYPDGSRILELSTKAAPSEAFQVSAQFRGWLGKRGIESGGEQQTKTAAALKFFSAQLRAGKNGKA